MLEIPEAFVIARQLRETVAGRRVTSVTAAHSPHKFAFFSGDPAEYPAHLTGRTLDTAEPLGGLIEVTLGDQRLLLGDGANLRYHATRAERPAKHQLLLELDDGSALSVSVQMYGGMWLFLEGEFDNRYYLVAKEKPSPLSAEFDAEYFSRLLDGPDAEKLSVKAFLATEQRIPGLGNGVLQDIAWTSRLHPKRKIGTLGDADRERLFSATKALLREMADNGGRDTERDLLGEPGGYATVMSRLHLGEACPACGTPIESAAYLGGKVYFCPSCQQLG